MGSSEKGRRSYAREKKTPVCLDEGRWVVTPTYQPAMAPAQPRPAGLLTLPAHASSFPPYCANCGAPADSAMTTSHQQNKVTVTYTIPHCTACVRRAKGHASKSLVLFFGVVGFAGLASLSGFPLRDVPAVGVAVTFVLSALAGLVAFVVLRPGAPPAPATSSTLAVRLMSFNGAASYFHVTNVPWAQHVAQANGGQVAFSPPRPYRATGHLATALVLPLALAGAVWASAHPSVCFYNPTGQPLAFYVDGQATGQPVAPGAYVKEDVSYGNHVFGWAAPGESGPTSTTTATVTSGRQHLLNPDEAGCFWVRRAAYGNAKVGDLENGPQPIQPFYTFRKVDIWFGDVPKSIRTKQSGETRVAVQNYTECSRFRKTCARAIVDEALACDANAETDAEASRCWAKCSASASR